MAARSAAPNGLPLGRARRRSAGSRPGPGPSVPGSGSARRRGGPGRHDAATAVAALARRPGPGRGTRRGRRPRSRPRAAGRRARRRGGGAPRRRAGDRPLGTGRAGGGALATRGLVVACDPTARDSTFCLSAAVSAEGSKTLMAAVALGECGSGRSRPSGTGRRRVPRPSREWGRGHLVLGSAWASYGFWLYLTLPLIAVAGAWARHTQGRKEKNLTVG